MLTAGPAPATAPVLLGAAVALVVVGVLADPAGRVLALPAALVLLVLGLRDLLLRPVLQADAFGIVVVSGLRRRAFAWPQVEGLRVVTDRRARLLELDVGETVVVLGRQRLGRPPEGVLEDLRALRPAGPTTGRR